MSHANINANQQGTERDKCAGCRSTVQLVAISLDAPFLQVTKSCLKHSASQHLICSMTASLENDPSVTLTSRT